MVNFDNKKIRDILVSGSYISEEDMQRVEKASQGRRSSLVNSLMSSGLLTKDLLGQAIAESFGVPYADLNSNQPVRETVLKIPENIAKKFNTVLYKEDDKSAVITTSDPKQTGIVESLHSVFPGKTLYINFSLQEDIKAIFVHYKKSLDTRFSKIIAQEKKIAPEILDQIFADALIYNASDIHFEPQLESVVVRFRVDGLMREAGSIPKEYYENILNRIKIQSSLRIDEHFIAQDGSIRYEKDDLRIDLRVSIVPTVEGEKIVLRVLGAYVEGFSFSDLGLSNEQQQILSEVSSKPFGMIIVTGPTGSGKTTTLYSVLRILNNPEFNITTIEDPVEYKILGVNQIQVNPHTGLTFAKGLRSIVRQDPDTILVGEIRDKETAEIAVNAALTGHLLLSTFHANDAATAIPRLLDMGVEEFLLASTLELIIAQRLVRKICDKCKYSVSVPTKDIKLKNIEQYLGSGEVTLYKGKTCSACNNTGYKGRTAIFEFIKVTPEMQALALTNPSSQEIWKLAREQGARSLFENGMDKVKNGVTTLEELLRVSEPPEDSFVPKPAPKVVAGNVTPKYDQKK